jgi:hypothetical protein
MSAPSLSICFHIPTVELGSEGPSLPPSNHKKKKEGDKNQEIMEKTKLKANEGKKQQTPIQETDKNRCWRRRN